MEWLLISWPTLILLGLALRMSLQMHYGARGPEPGDPVYAFLNTTSWVLLILGLVPAIVGGALTLFGLIILGLAAMALVEAIVGRRAAQRRSTCTLLTLLARRGKQLDASVLLAGRSLGGFVGRSTRKLFAALRGGTPLAAAIRRFPRALPREAVAYTAAGETMQAEAAALKELSRGDLTAEMTSIWRACVDRLSYLACVLLFMGGVMTFLMIRIIPEFRKIFDEFSIALPAVTEIAIQMSEYFLQSGMLALLLLATIALFMGVFIIGVCYLLDYPVLQSVTDGLFRGRHLADVMRILAVATEHRQPLADVLARLARDFPADTVRLRLRAAAGAVADGSDWRDALRDARIISPAEQGLLKTAEQVGNLPWALRAIATRNERRGAYRFSAALHVIYPCVILLLGALVGFFVVALFVPLVQLINALT